MIRAVCLVFLPILGGVASLEAQEWRRQQFLAEIWNEEQAGVKSDANKEAGGGANSILKGILGDAFSLTSVVSSDEVSETDVPTWLHSPRCAFRISCPGYLKIDPSEERRRTAFGAYNFAENGRGIILPFGGAGALSVQGTIGVIRNGWNVFGEYEWLHHESDNVHQHLPIGDFDFREEIKT